MKIYLAGPYGAMSRLLEWEHVLLTKDHECTSKWLRGAEDGQSRADAAQMDLDDIDRADAVVSMTLPVGTMFSSGGRHVEFGYALARDKLVIIVEGGIENIFHNLPQVVMCDNIEAVMEYLS